MNLEVQRLKEAGAIKEIFFLRWLENTVVVKKKNGKWRVCVDFTDLNRVCPKDPFPMPKIDQLVDATYGHPRMSFLDAFQGYHQIALGYLISTRGIEANPDQINAVNHLIPPSNPKEVQVLIGMLAALNRFISKFADRCKPFYQLLKKWKGFH